MAHEAGGYPYFFSMKLLEEYFCSPLDWMVVHYRVIPSIKFISTHLYTWVERGAVRVKCLAQEHNTMSPARAQTCTTWSRDGCTNHEAMVPLTFTVRVYIVTLCLLKPRSRRGLKVSLDILEPLRLRQIQTFYKIKCLLAKLVKLTVTPWISFLRELKCKIHLKWRL